MHWIKFFALLVVVDILNMQCSNAQSDVTRPAFEVTSIKRHVNSGRHNILDLSKTTTSPEMLSMSSTSAGSLIEFAYDLKSTAQIAGSKPDWLNRESYDVIAKASSPVSSGQLKVMMQALLAERFQLKCHRETKEGPVYVLVPGNKVKLVPATDEEIPEFNSLPVHTRRGDEIIFSYIEKKVSMAQLADWLSSRFRRLVVDRSGMQGAFNFTLTITADQAMEIEEFISAVQEQLGLKVESQRGPVENVIIEHIERPSEN